MTLISSLECKPADASGDEMMTKFYIEWSLFAYISHLYYSIIFFLYSFFSLWVCDWYYQQITNKTIQGYKSSTSTDKLQYYIIILLVYIDNNNSSQVFCIQVLQEHWGSWAYRLQEQAQQAQATPIVPQQLAPVGQNCETAALTARQWEITQQWNRTIRDTKIRFWLIESLSEANNKQDPSFLPSWSLPSWLQVIHTQVVLAICTTYQPLLRVYYVNNNDQIDKRDINVLYIANINWVHHNHSRPQNFLCLTQSIFWQFGEQ